MGEPALVCAACGVPSDGGVACAKCGGTLVKAPAPSPDAFLPRTVIRKSGPPQQPAEGFKLPAAGRAQQAFGDAEPKKAARAPRRGPSTLERAQDALVMGLSRLNYVVKSVLAIIFLLALALAGLLLLSQHRAMRAPRFVAKSMAENYLEMVRVGDYANAYMMLTPAAQSVVSLDEFRQARDARVWAWSNARVVALEPDAALIAYDLSIEGRAPEPDYLYLTLEGKRWLRPYNWTLIQKAEAALRENDPDMAVLRAQAAAHVNARDPIARSYLCEAYYFRRLLEDARRECRHALELARRYPSKLGARGSLHISATLADALRGVGEHAEAAAVYDGLLSSAGLTQAERCDALKARAASRQALGQTAQARADLAAARQCPDQ